jgi:hypothetical protein
VEDAPAADGDVLLRDRRPLRRERRVEPRVWMLLASIRQHGPAGPWMVVDGRARSRGTEHVGEHVVKWMCGGAKRQCDRARSGPRGIVRRRASPAPPRVLAARRLFGATAKAGVVSSTSVRWENDSYRCPADRRGPVSSAPGRIRYPIVTPVSGMQNKRRRGTYARWATLFSEAPHWSDSLFTIYYM